MEKYTQIVESLAEVGYEKMFDACWNELSEDSIERSLWKQISVCMLSKLMALHRDDCIERLEREGYEWNERNKNI